MMSEAIKNFPKQFEFEPEIENADALRGASKFVICGMGGSNLAGVLLKRWNGSLDIKSHRDYGLPGLPDLSERLIIFSSYSGNTEETLDGFGKVIEKGLQAAAIATGGRLLEMAKEHGTPYVQIPDTGIQPRCTLGFNIRALMKLIGLEKALEESGALAQSLVPAAVEEKGKELAVRLKNHVPVIYCSGRNVGVAYNWKIKLNETGKIPAFFNTLPELNHNEMNAFDVQDGNKALCEKFGFIFIKDAEDHPQVQKRMSVLEKMYVDRGLLVEIQELTGETVFEKIFSSFLLADWTAFYIAEQSGLESEQVPMVEEFKKLI